MRDERIGRKRGEGSDRGRKEIGTREGGGDMVGRKKGSNMRAKEKVEENM